MVCQRSKIVRLHPSLVELLSQERQKVWNETGIKISWTQAQQKILAEYNKYKFKLKKDNDERQFKV